MADIKNVEFDSKSGYQHLTFTSYSSTKNGSNWEITANFKVVCDSGTSISATTTNNRGFYGTIGGNDIGKVWFKKEQAWSSGTYTYTVKFTIPFSTTTSVAVSLGVCDNDGNTGAAGTWPKTITGYTMTLTLPTYSVTYNANGGTGTVSSQTKTYGTDLTLRSSGFTKKTTSTIKITLDGNGGTDLTAKSGTRTGTYPLSKWTLNSTGGTEYALGGTYKTNAAAVFYAKWGSISYTNPSFVLGSTSRANETAKITTELDANGGTVEFNIKETTKTTTYTFEGWGTSSSATTATYNATSTYAFSASATLYAVWSAVATNGSFVLPTPTRAGYKFVHWQRADNPNLTYNAGNPFGPSSDRTGDQRLVAIWKKDTSVCVNVNGAWKDGTPYVNVGGIWTEGVVDVNVNGTWTKIT